MSVKERQSLTPRPLQQFVAGAVMTSPPKSPAEPLTVRNGRIEAQSDDVTTAQPSGSRPRQPQTPETQREDRENVPLTPGSPEEPPSFDWTDFEQRYEEALQEADLREKEILKEADRLAQYFRQWASAASAHDDERAAKRLQTRRRFVNLSEDRLAEKQRHYEEVMHAFQSALALLQSK